VAADDQAEDVTGFADTPSAGSKTVDQTRFDAVTRTLSRIPSRRDILRGLASAGLGLGSLRLSTVAAAKKKPKRKKKQKKCSKAGQTTSKKRKRCCQGLVQDGTGRCAQPASDCIPSTCGPTACGNLPDGCGGTLNCGGCASNSLCDAGVCRPCTVTCVSGVPTVCGADLQLALAAGGTVYVCPGRYQENFTLDAAVRVIGAGEGAGVATDTILTANGLGRVLTINPGTGLVALDRLRITGGSADSGGGIFHQGTTLRMTECTVSGNTVTGTGGGIYAVRDTTLELTHCTVRDNEAIAGGDGGGLSLFFATATLTGSTQVRGNVADLGGGILNNVDATLVIAETCRVTENTAAGAGGGILNVAGTVILQGADPSPIVVNNCEENCAGDAVAKCSTAPPVSCPP
jgi:parallel beta-helix repeat protein